MSKVILILGGGPRIGWAVARKYLAEGYSVAIGSRNPDMQKAAEEGILAVSTDVTHPQSVEAAFMEVRTKLGIPNVVVYNGIASRMDVGISAALTFPVSAEDPFAIDVQSFEHDTAVNLIGGYVALQQTVQCFKDLGGSEVPRVFIATGNVTPFSPLPAAMTLGAGKAALVYLIHVAVMSYSTRNFRFYFASQVTDNGGPVPYPDVNGEAHGLMYWELVKKGTQDTWDVRFRVNEKGQPLYYRA